jgi:hypothetical protein
MLTNIELTEHFIGVLIQIILGYEIVGDLEPDGNDHDGLLYLATCVNGEIDRSYNIQTNKQNALYNYKKSVSEFGLSINGDYPYCIDPKMMDEECIKEIKEWDEETHRFKYSYERMDGFELVQISDVVRDKWAKEKDEIVRIVNEYKKKKKTIYEMNDWNRFHFYSEHMHKRQKMERYDKLMSQLNKLVLTNKDIFIKTAIKYLDSDNVNDLLKPILY